MNNKRAVESGWSLEGSGCIAKEVNGEIVFLSNYVSGYNVNTGEYVELYMNRYNILVTSENSDVMFSDLPMSVCRLIALWMGTLPCNI